MRDSRDITEAVRRAATDRLLVALCLSPPIGAAAMRAPSGNWLKAPSMRLNSWPTTRRRAPLDRAGIERQQRFGVRNPSALAESDLPRRSAGRLARTPRAVLADAAAQTSRCPGAGSILNALCAIADSAAIIRNKLSSFRRSDRACSRTTIRPPLGQRISVVPVRRAEPAPLRKCGDEMPRAQRVSPGQRCARLVALRANQVFLDLDQGADRRRQLPAARRAGDGFVRWGAFNEAGSPIADRSPVISPS